MNSDYSRIEHLLGAYGGMGSFNDLIICQDTDNGKIIWKDGYTEKNDTLRHWRSKAWELASFIKKNHEIEGSGT